MLRVAVLLLGLGLLAVQSEGCKFKDLDGSGEDINGDGNLSGKELPSGSLCYDVFRVIKEILMVLEVECSRPASNVTDEEVEDLGREAGTSGSSSGSGSGSGSSSGSSSGSNEQK